MHAWPLFFTQTEFGACFVHFVSLEMSMLKQKTQPGEKASASCHGHSAVRADGSQLYTEVYLFLTSAQHMGGTEHPVSLLSQG